MKTAKKYNPDLILHGNLIRAILSLAIPVVINSFLQTMYNLTDTYWLEKLNRAAGGNQSCDTDAEYYYEFGSGITVAGAVLIAQYIGAGEKEDARSMAIRYLPVPWDLPWSVPHCVFWEHPLSSTGWELTEELHIMQEFICGWSSGICPFYIWSTFFPQYIRHRRYGAPHVP